MCWQARNKMLVVSLSMAAAGILACVAALYDSFVPKGSLLAFLATMFPLGLLVAGIVVSLRLAVRAFREPSRATRRATIEASAARLSHGKRAAAAFSRRD